MRCVCLNTLWGHVALWKILLTYLKRFRLSVQNAGRVATARQLLAVDVADAAALDARCQPPIAHASRKQCAALFRTLARCRRSFGRFTLRCSHAAATACSTSLAQIQGGRCGECNSFYDHGISVAADEALFW